MAEEKKIIRGSLSSFFDPVDFPVFDFSFAQLYILV